jgi:predicted membrane chloride channel (bestrophin family)
MPKSLILRGLGVQTFGVTMFSLFIVIFNTIVEKNLVPFAKYLPIFSFPSLPFSLTSSALGLLLVFRTNVSTYSVESDEL